MLNAIKRLALGIGLLAAASAILLYADRGHRKTTGPRPKVQRIAILQHANTSVLEDGLRGTIDALAERGFHDGDRVTIERFNAQGDMPTGIAIARQVTAGGYDLVITSSTPSMQAVANNNRDGAVRHIFTLVADPFASGVGLDRADPLKHPPYMVGQGVFPPVEKAFTLAKRMLPSLERIGVAWNPSETNSLLFVTKAREVAKQMGLTLLEANVDTTSAVTDAINSLVARNAQTIWVGGDNTVIAAIGTVIANARRLGIPVITILPGKPDRGTLFDAGPDFYQVGRQGGFVAADVLEGADIAKIPVRDVQSVVPAFLSVNTTILKELKEPWRIPDDILAEANVVVDATGMHKKDKPAEAAASGPRKKWHLSLVELNRVLDVEESEQGLFDGLKEAGLVEGRDYDYKTRDAQGDMATVSAIMDAAVSDNADVIIPFSTPTLQAALQRAKGSQIVFNYVADPFAAGAGTSDTSHVPNVTGVYLVAAYDQMIPIIKQYMPTVHLLGTVYVPAEVNMVSQLAAVSKEIKKAGFELKAIPANSASEVGEATLALISQHVDVICQLPGNLIVSAFPSIAQAARRAKMPMFVFQGGPARAGAVAAVARDYYESGHETAKLVVRVMKGERPTNMPFVPMSKTRIIVNPAAARENGLVTPPDLLSRATEVVK